MPIPSPLASQRRKLRLREINQMPQVIQPGSGRAGIRIKNVDSLLLCSRCLARQTPAWAPGAASLIAMACPIVPRYPSLLLWLDMNAFPQSFPLTNPSGECSEPGSVWDELSAFRNLYIQPSSVPCPSDPTFPCRICLNFSECVSGRGHEDGSATS